MSQVTVEGLEQQLEELVELVHMLTDRQDERIHRLEARLAELRGERDGGSPPAAAPDAHARPWTARATLAQWRELADWVDWLQGCYQPQGEYRIPPCWPWHPGAAEELAGLHASWKTAMRAAEESQDSGDQALYWHDRYLWDTLIRANRVIPNVCRNSGHVQPKALPATDRTGWPEHGAQSAERSRRGNQEHGTQAVHLAIPYEEETRMTSHFEYFVKMHRGYTPARRIGLWRRRDGEAWEYLSLLDWQWHRTGEGGRVQHPPAAEALEPVSADRAAELEADRQGWVQYWALYLDEQDFREGVDPVTVVRRRSSPERVLDEAFIVGNKWAPDPAIHEFTHSRTNNHLEEIDVTEAERLLQKLRGVKGATGL